MLRMSKWGFRNGLHRRRRPSPSSRNGLHRWRRPSPSFRNGLHRRRRPFPSFRNSLHRWRRPSPSSRNGLHRRRKLQSPQKNGPRKRSNPHVAVGRSHRRGLRYIVDIHFVAYKLQVSLRFDPQLPENRTSPRPYP